MKFITFEKETRSKRINLSTPKTPTHLRPTTLALPMEGEVPAGPASTGYIYVDTTHKLRMAPYKWRIKKDGRIMASIAMPIKSINPKKTKENVHVDLRRFIYDLTEYPNVDLRNNLFFENGDWSDYTCANLIMTAVSNAPALKTIYPNVWALYTKHPANTYGAMCFLPDGTNHVFPLDEFNGYQRLNKDRQNRLFRAVAQKVQEAALYYDEHCLRLYGPSYNKLNFLSSKGIG